MRVLMHPPLSSFDRHESGIKRVVEAYYRCSSFYDIEYVECHIEEENMYDLYAVHAGSSDRFPKSNPIVAHVHGLYWTADHANSPLWERYGNANVVESIRLADVVTVPSEWVAESIRRDVRINPVIVPHGIDWQEYVHKERNHGYILWNKNRDADVCNPKAVGELAIRFPNLQFLTTFAPRGYESVNILIIGIVPHSEMKTILARAGVYLSTTKETFGIGILEALACGVPVLGYNHGGNKIMVEHGVNGYLARPNDMIDLARGLEYCLKYRDVLSRNAMETVKKFTWDAAMGEVSYAYKKALELHEKSKRPVML